jgi:hypothetical protein
MLAEADARLRNTRCVDRWGESTEEGQYCISQDLIESGGDGKRRKGVEGREAHENGKQPVGSRLRFDPCSLRLRGPTSVVLDNEAIHTYIHDCDGFWSKDSHTDFGLAVDDLAWAVSSISISTIEDLLSLRIEFLGDLGVCLLSLVDDSLAILDNHRYDDVVFKHVFELTHLRELDILYTGYPEQTIQFLLPALAQFADCLSPEGWKALLSPSGKRPFGSIDGWQSRDGESGRCRRVC